MIYMYIHIYTHAHTTIPIYEYGRHSTYCDVLLCWPELG